MLVKKEIINMNSQMIETIEHRMMTHLDAHQQKILHDTLCQCLEEERLKANDDDNQNFLKASVPSSTVFSMRLICT